MKENIIKALFKIDLDDGRFMYFDKLTDFENYGGTVGVYRELKGTNKVPYAISLTVLPTTPKDGYHLMVAFGFQEDPPAFFPNLLIKAPGRLSYHYLNLPANAGDVYFQ